MQGFSWLVHDIYLIEVKSHQVAIWSMTASIALLLSENMSWISFMIFFVVTFLSISKNLSRLSCEVCSSFHEQRTYGRSINKYHLTEIPRLHEGFAGIGGGSISSMSHTPSGSFLSWNPSLEHDNQSPSSDLPGLLLWRQMYCFRISYRLWHQKGRR